MPKGVGVGEGLDNVKNRTPNFPLLYLWHIVSSEISRTEQFMIPYFFLENDLIFQFLVKRN